MKFIATLALAATANAAIECGPGDYTDLILGFAQGFQDDHTATDTDCYFSATSYAGTLDSLKISVEEFTADDWLAPVYSAQESLVEMTSVFSDCQSTNAAKQLMTRTSSLGGLFEVFGTALGAYVRNSKTAGTSELYNNYKAINSSATCRDQALATAITFSYLLNFEAPEETFYDEVSFSLIDSIARR